MPGQITVAELAQIAAVLLNVRDQHDTRPGLVVELRPYVHEKWSEAFREPCELVVAQFLIAKDCDLILKPDLFDRIEVAIGHRRREIDA